MKGRGGIALWAAGAAALAVAAAISAAVVVRGGSAAPQPREIRNEGAPGWPRAFRDRDGVEVVLAAPPRRIVSLSLASDEVLLTLGGRRRFALISDVAADPTQSYVADKASRFPPERRIVTADGAAERILGVRPDLVAATPWTNAATVEHLRRAGVPVIRFAGGATLAEIRDSVRAIGRAAGLDAEAARLVADMDERLTSLAARVRDLPRVRTMVCSYSGAELWTGGRGTLIGELIAAAGGVNAAAEDAEGLGSVSMERILALQPEAIVLSSPNASDADVLRAFLDKPGADGLAAAKAGRLHVIPARAMTTTSHFAAEAAEAVARALHPEAFKGA